MRIAVRTLIAGIVLVFAASAAARLPARAAVLPADDTDRSAFRAWFTFLADVKFELPASDVVDCASLVRHAYREALREHSPEWYRRSRLPVTVAFPDVRHRPAVRDGVWPLFRIARDPDRFAEFADAETLVRFNARLVSREARAAEPGDLLHFRQAAAASPHHLMIFVGPS